MFGRKIKHMLEVRGMTKTELAEKTGLHRNLIGKLVEDKQENTTTDTIIKIAEALNVPPGYFFDTGPEGIKGHAYTPLEALNLPEHIKDFIKKQDNMGYLVLAHKLEEENIPVEYVQKIIEAYEHIIKSGK